MWVLGAESPGDGGHAGYFLSPWVTTEAAGQKDTWLGVICAGEDSAEPAMSGGINLKEMLLRSRDLTSVPRDQSYDISGRVRYQKRSKQNKRVHFSALCINGLSG